MLQRWEHMKIPSFLVQKPWASPQAHRHSSHSGGDSVLKLSKPAGYFLKSQHCTKKSCHIGTYVENQRPEVEWPGQATWRLSSTPLIKATPFMNFSNQQSFDDRAECRGRRDGHILLRKILVTKKQLPRDAFIRKSRWRLSNHQPILSSQEYPHQA